MAQRQPNLIERQLVRLDGFQKKHIWLNFPYAVIKKYGEDDAGYQSALITYYGFLSLFPLLLVATSVLKIVAHTNRELGDRLATSIAGYFPVIGKDLQTNIHSLGKTGVGLFVGLVLTFYGARGVADVLQHALNHIWNVPKKQRAAFPKSTVKSIAILLVGGSGLITSSVLAGYTANASQLMIFKLLSIVVSLVVLIASFSFVFKIAVSDKNLSYQDVVLSAVIAAVGILLVQSFGSYLLTRQLKNLSNLYGTFAIVLGLLFWIYLQAQIVLYAVEISTVVKLKLWPRNLV